MESMEENNNLLVSELVKKCIEKDLSIVFAESMTGGLLASQITSISDASKVLKESFVVYSDQAKIKLLKCKVQTIEKYSVYSKEVVFEMLDGLADLSQADIRVSISGIAGPKSYHNLDLGTVFIAMDIMDKRFFFTEKFQGDRLSIRNKTSNFIFKMIIKNI